ncbi:MAG: hypothetical protein ACUVQX_05270 [Candidatus Bathycorpusculaceae bacterium]
MGQLAKSRNWRFVEPEKASIENIKLVHDIEYISFVKAVCDSGRGLLDSEDTVASPKNFEAAFYAVGGALKVVNLVMEERFENVLLQFVLRSSR